MNFRSYSELKGDDRSQLLSQVVAQRERVTKRLETVGKVVAVMSGKGGVGKSHVTALVATALSGAGRSVGVLDADLRSPTVARLLGAGGPLGVESDGVRPAVTEAGVKLVSTDLLLDEGQPLSWREPSGERFLWRGALETGTLREFLSDVIWGQLDVLLVDLPPGADGVTDLKELVPGLSGAIVVTIPSEESRRSVSRTMRSAIGADIEIVGVIENMSGYRCEACDRLSTLFHGTAGQDLAHEFGVRLLAKLPFSPAADGSPMAVSDADGLGDVLREVLR